MRVLVDNDVRSDVADYLRRQGFEVHLSRELLGADAPDWKIAAFADSFDAVVVTHNHKDFVKLISRRPVDGNRQRFRRAGRISLDCSQRGSARRIEQLLELVRFEYERSAAQADRRVILTIHDHFIAIDR